MPRGLASGQAGGGTNFSSFPSLSLLLIFSSLPSFLREGRSSFYSFPPLLPPMALAKKEEREKGEKTASTTRVFFFETRLLQSATSLPPLFFSFPRFPQTSSFACLFFFPPPLLLSLARRPPPFPFNARRRRLPFPPQFAKATAPLRNALPTFHT